MSEPYILKETEIRLKLSEGRTLYSPIPLSSPDAAIQAMASLMKEYDHEVACIVNLDNKLRPINFSIVGIGNQNACPVSISSIYKSALLSNASSLLFLHNHPSGELNPSDFDLDLTRKLIATGKLLEIPLTDHVIVAGYTGQWYSIRSEHPEIDFNANVQILQAPKQENVRHKKLSR